MSLTSPEQLLLFCTRQVMPTVCRVADQCLQERYQIEIKEHGDFVTTIDKKINEELICELRTLLPEAGVISEESAAAPEKLVNWIIDPIDGTTNFIYGLPFAVSVALKEQSSGETLLGIVYDPKRETVYYACKGCGSYRLCGKTQQKLSVGTFPNDEGPVFFGMPYDRSKTHRIFQIAERCYRIASDLKRIGPASLDICMVAAGNAKAYAELDLKVWDVSAGILILKEAGGFYKKQDDLFVFACNADTIRQILQ